MAAICNQVIGLWNDFDNTGTITLNGLKRRVKEEEETYEHCRDNGFMGTSDSDITRNTKGRKYGLTSSTTKRLRSGAKP